MRILLLSLLALLLTAGEVLAQRSIDERFAASPMGTVEIVNVAGSVRVTGWNRNEIHVTGTLGEGTERLDISRGDRASIRVILPRQGRNVRGSNLEVRVPARRTVIVRTTSASIDIGDMQGDVEARSVSGRVRVGGGSRQVRAVSTSGAVEIAATNARQVQAKTTSGAVRIGGSSQSIDAESVNGTLEIAASTPQVRAKTVSGSMALRGVSGSADLSTVSGRATVEGGRFSRLQYKSVSGDLRFRGEIEPKGVYNLESHSGSLELRLPRTTAADFEVRTFSGRITNEFGPEPERTSRYAPGWELRFTSGGGGALVAAKSFSGAVRLLRQ